MLFSQCSVAVADAGSRLLTPSLQGFNLKFPASINIEHPDVDDLCWFHMVGLKRLVLNIVMSIGNFDLDHVFLGLN